MIKTLFSLVLIVLFSCNEKNATIKAETITNNTVINNKNTTTETLKPSVIVESVLPQKIHFGDIEVLVSRNDLLLVSSNEKNAEKYQLKTNGIVTDVIVTDVNGDGVDEFYCITNRGDISAFASFSNKSYGEIYVAKKPLDFYSTIVKVKNWELKNRKLAMTFKNKDGSFNTVRYKLELGETSFQLIAD